jgi:tetratricopeptide (TPR) repeat protein
LASDSHEFSSPRCRVLRCDLDFAREISVLRNGSYLKYALHITAALYLALHLAAPLLPGAMWGVDALGYHPNLVIPFLLLSVFLIYFCTDSSRVSSVVSLATRWSRFVEMRWLLVALFGAAFLVFSVQTHLLGDGRLLVRELILGAESPEARAPLSLFLIQFLHGLLGDAVMTYRVISVGAGLAFAYVTFLISRELTQSSILRFGVSVLLIVQGYAVLFFGYVETYSILFLASSLYVYAAIRYLNGITSLGISGAILGVAICFHLAALALVPSFLALPFVRKDLIQIRTVGAVAMLPVVSLGTLYFLDYVMPWNGGESLLAKHILPIGSLPEGSTAAYTIFDAYHVVDLANALMIAGPAFVVGFPLFFSSHIRDAVGLWFLVLCVPPLLMTWIINPEIGAFRDWDVLAFPTLFLTVGICRFLARLDDTSAMSYLILLLGVSLLHLVPWVLVNSDADRSVHRFQELLRTTPLTRRAAAYGWDTVGGYYREEGRFESAYRAYLTAIEVDPTHPRIRRTAGHTAGELGLDGDAVRHFEAAKQLLPDDETLAANYGKALLKVGRNDEAAEQFSAVLSGAPDHPDIVRLLAVAKFRSEKYAEALALSNSAINRYSPGNAEDHLMVGSVYALRRDLVRAIASFREALKIAPKNVDALRRLGAAHQEASDPKSALAVLNQIPESARGFDVQRAIGVSHYALEAFDSAAVYYERALVNSGSNADLHYRLGTARLAAGRAGSAIQPLLKAIELDPTLASAYRNLGTSYADLQQNDRAKEILRKLLELQPNIPDRDDLQNWILEH